MKLRVVGAVCLSILATTWITGCAGVTDQITDKAAEKAAESALKSATGADVDLDKNGESVKVKTEAGEMEFGKTTIPDGFPSEFPIYKGAKVTNSVKSTDPNDKSKTGFQLILQTGDSVSKVVDYYKSELVKKGYTISDSAALTDGATNLLLKKDDQSAGNVMIMKAEGETNIVIWVAK